MCIEVIYGLLINSRFYCLNILLKKVNLYLNKICQLFAHGRWFSPDIPASSTTKIGRHDIAEILLKVALNSINQIKSIKSSFDGPNKIDKNL
jgi:hypothetical protein